MYHCNTLLLAVRLRYAFLSAENEQFSMQHIKEDACASLYLMDRGLIAAMTKFATVFRLTYFPARRSINLAEIGEIDG